MTESEKNKAESKDQAESKEWQARSEEHNHLWTMTIVKRMNGPETTGYVPCSCGQLYPENPRVMADIAFRVTRVVMSWWAGTSWEANTSSHTFLDVAMDTLVRSAMRTYENGGWNDTTAKWYEDRLPKALSEARSLYYFVTGTFSARGTKTDGYIPLTPIIEWCVNRAISEMV